MWRFSLAMLLIVTLMFLAGGLRHRPGSPETTVTQQGCNQQSLITENLRSISRFALIPRENVFASLRFSENTLSGGFPIPIFSNGEVLGGVDTTKQITARLHQNVTAGTFVGSENGVSDSLVVIYDAELDSQPKFISGFLRDGDGSFFIEPVLPLLLAHLQAYGINDPGTLGRIESCFPSNIGYHILYRSQNTNWYIRLDPTAGTEVAPASGTMGAQTTPTNVKIEVTMVGDQRFYDYYNNPPNSTPTAAQDAELSYASGLYALQLPYLQFDRLDVSDWVQSGPGSFLPDINAYSLLCDFAQGYPSPPDPINGWSHTEQSGASKIVYLSSGYDFGTMSPGTGRVDTGSLCPGGGCGGDGTNIVGEAEGIGGYKNEEPPYSSRSCARGLAHFDPPGHHAVSQQIPKRDSRSTHNYDALIEQRALLTAHEWGHLLGAFHSTKPPCQTIETIMCSELTQSNSFTFSQESVNQIYNCVVVLNGENCPTPPP